MCITKSIIYVCSGGLGNRLRPLASLERISKLVDRELLIWWIKDHRFDAEFNDVFKNKLNFINEPFIQKINNAKVYLHSLGAVKLSSDVIGIPLMIDICNKFGVNSISNFYNSISSNEEEFVFVYADNFIGNSIIDYDFIYNLMPVSEITYVIDYYTKELGLNKNIVGVHARGTDFFVGADSYIQQMKDIESKNKNVKFYLATDDRDYEKEIINSFNYNQIIIMPDKIYASKKDKNKGFKYNTYLSKRAIIDSVIEMYLLAKTNILVGNNRSTYLQICKLLSKVKK